MESPICPCGCGAEIGRGENDRGQKNHVGTDGLKRLLAKNFGNARGHRSYVPSRKKGKQPLLKKRRKNFCYAGPWALSPTTPMVQINKVFLLLFVHKK
jgi:hypothetical protein